MPCKGWFSTLGYQPGIVFSQPACFLPFATLVLVLITLFAAALPLHKRVAQASQTDRAVSLCWSIVSGVGRQDFRSGIAWIRDYRFCNHDDAVGGGCGSALCSQPFRTAMACQPDGGDADPARDPRGGFSEGVQAIEIAVVLVAAYLVLNAIVTTRAMAEIFRRPELMVHWKAAVFAQHPHWLGIVGICLLLFPRLALGLSGFETGVAVMPLIAGANLAARIRNTQKLLTTAGNVDAFLIAVL